ncbi:hypothetical protein ACFZDK_10505 [Streptomyces sp. NPDC007901]
MGGPRESDHRVLEAAAPGSYTAIRRRLPWWERDVLSYMDIVRLLSRLMG